MEQHILLLRLFDFGSDSYSGWEAALGIWNDKFQEIMDILMQAPDTIFGGKLWNTMSAVMGAFTAIGYMLVILFFYMGMTKEAFTFMEMKRTGFILKMFTRLFITIWAVQNAGKLIIKVSNIFIALINSAVVAAGNNGASVLTMDDHLADRCEKAGFVKQLTVFLISLIALIVVIVISFRILITVYGRLFKVLLAAVVAPLTLACFAGQGTSHIGLHYVKAFIGICMEGLLIALCCIIFNAYVDAMPTDENVEVRAYDITQTIETQVDESTHRVVTIYRYHITQNPNTVTGYFLSGVKLSVSSAGYYDYIESGGEEEAYVVFTSENSNSDMREDFVEKMNEFTAYTKSTGGGVVKKFIGYVTKTIFMMLILAASVSLCDQLSSKIFGIA